MWWCRQGTRRRGWGGARRRCWARTRTWSRRRRGRRVGRRHRGRGAARPGPGSRWAPGAATRRGWGRRRPRSRGARGHGGAVAGLCRRRRGLAPEALSRLLGVAWPVGRRRPARWPGRRPGPGGRGCSCPTWGAPGGGAARPGRGRRPGAAGRLPVRAVPAGPAGRLRGRRRVRGRGRAAVEDVALAGRLKAAGHRLDVRLAPGLAAVRMYGRFGDLWEGLAKNRPRSGGRGGRRPGRRPGGGRVGRPGWPWPPGRGAGPPRGGPPRAAARPSGLGGWLVPGPTRVWPSPTRWPTWSCWPSTPTQSAAAARGTPLTWKGRTYPAGGPAGP